MKLAKTQFAIAVGVAAMGLSVESFSHGYVSEPKSRSYLCKLGDNTGCGAVQYEPQSVEGPDGNPRLIGDTLLPSVTGIDHVRCLVLPLS